MSSLEILAVMVSFTGIWLTARRWLLCWPVSLVACGLYSKIFLDARLYADMVLQVLFGLALIYGWYEWRRGKKISGDVAVEPLPTKSAVLALAAGSGGAVAVGWMTSRYTDAALPWMDAMLSSFSLVAQYWTARRHAASWLLWIVLDTLYVGMFAIKGLWPTAGLYAAMTMLAVLGYRRWRGAPQGRDKSTAGQSIVGIVAG